MKPACDVLLEEPRWSDSAVVEALVSSAVAKAVDLAQPTLHPDAEVSFIFSNDSRIRTLNAHWRHKDTPTNVLSFPAAHSADLKNALLLGDVILAYETIAREAAEEGKPFADHATHMIVHGFLHLIGYDHETDADAAEMENLESRILTALGLPDPWPADNEARKV